MIRRIRKLKARALRDRRPRHPWFLELPGEIRNIIYEYVLTFDGQTLEYRRLRHTNLWAFPDLNQLKYVCKQIYQDTLRLELRFNILRFSNHHRKSSINSEVLFANYVKRLGPECEKLQHVEIVDPPMYNNLRRIYFPSPTEKFAKIADVCRANPQMRVEYRISEFKYGISTKHRCVFCPSTIIVKGILYNLALRGRDLTFLFKTGTSGIWPDRIRNIANRWRRQYTVENFHADNLTFFPYNRSFQKARFKNGFNDDKQSFNEPSEGIWVNWAENWVLNGF